MLRDEGWDTSAFTRRVRCCMCKKGHRAFFVLNLGFRSHRIAPRFCIAGAHLGVCLVQERVCSVNTDSCVRARPPNHLGEQSRPVLRVVRALNSKSYQPSVIDSGCGKEIDQMFCFAFRSSWVSTRAPSLMLSARCVRRRSGRRSWSSSRAKRVRGCGPNTASQSGSRKGRSSISSRSGDVSLPCV